MVGVVLVVVATDDFGRVDGSRWIAVLTGRPWSGSRSATHLVVKNFEEDDYHLGRLQFVVEAALNDRVPAFQQGDPQLDDLHEGAGRETRHDPQFIRRASPISQSWRRNLTGNRRCRTFYGRPCPTGKDIRGGGGRRR